MKGSVPGISTTMTTIDDQQSTSSMSPNSAGSSWRPPESYTVQQAAALTGLSEHTLRYYEKIGLVRPVQRQQSSGHRRYTRTDLAKLEALACLRATGMPIDQMRRYFELRAGGGDEADAAELQVLLSRHMQELQRRMAELQTHIEYVQLKIDYWCAVEARDEQAAAILARKAQDLIHAAVLPSLPSRIATDAATNADADKETAG